MSEPIAKHGIINSFSIGPYDKSNDQEQWIRISQGCPNQCPFCYEPRDEQVFPIPEIVRNAVKIMDMNLLSKPNALEIIRELGQKRVNGKVIRYELICGIDWRFLTQELANALKASRFKRIRLAWDFGYDQQFAIRKAIQKLVRAGYVRRDLTIFIICNWEIPFDECLEKLDLCKVWGVKVADCYFDGQTSPNITPLGWNAEHIKTFRARVRKHNQLVRFGSDPEFNQRKRGAA